MGSTITDPALCDIKSVSFIGAGGVGWSMAQALSRHFEIRQIFSRHISNAQALASIVGAEAIDSPTELQPTADLYIVALADNAVDQIIGQIPRFGNNALWALTSGSLPKEKLSEFSSRYGVIYPLQTFSRGLTVDFTDVPVFVEGCDEATTGLLQDVAKTISSSVSQADSKRRQRLHIAGVLTCNFVNHLWDTADEFLKADGLSLDVVRPLIRQTLDKTSKVSPHLAQTGPARRGDYEVMRSHIECLSDDDAELYRFLSNRILKSYSDNNEPNLL